MHKEIRDQHIQIRVTKDEKREIELSAQGPVSSWLRDLSLKRERKVYKELKQDPALVSAVHKIGVNVNQIAFFTNSMNATGQEPELIALQSELLEIKELLSKIVKTGL